MTDDAKGARQENVHAGALREALIQFEAIETAASAAAKALRVAIAEQPAEHVRQVPDKVLTIGQAAHVAGQKLGRSISYTSMRRWVIKFSLGTQLESGLWAVKEAALLKFLNGKPPPGEKFDQNGN
jgi:hypothetical protein